MNPLESRDHANCIQPHLDTTSVINLSSVSHGTFRAYRPWLMQRMVRLFTIDTPIPLNLSFEGVWELNGNVMPALKQRITDETDAIRKELSSPDSCYRPLFPLPPMPIMRIVSPGSLLRSMGEGTALERRKGLRGEIITLASKGKLTANAIRKPNYLTFLLSATERMLEAAPHDPLVRKLNIDVMGGMLLIGAVAGGRFLHTWNRLKHEWPTMNASQQAEVFTALAPFRDVENRAKHPGMSLIGDFISTAMQGSGPIEMSKGFTYLFESNDESKLDQEKRALIVNALETIAQSGSVYNRGVVEASCQTIDQLLFCSTEDEIAAIRSGNVTADYIRLNLDGMTAQEQIAILWTIRKLPSIRKLVQEDTLAWAHRAIPEAYLFLFDTREPNIVTGLAKNQRDLISTQFESIVRDKEARDYKPQLDYISSVLELLKA